MIENVGKLVNPIFNENRLKLGIFCFNTPTAASTVPEVHIPTWSNCLSVAQMADRAGLEAVVPIARWKGYLDDRFDHPSNLILEPFTFAAAMAQATSYSAVFATTHAPTLHPLVVAKQAATIDAISGGRFVMNVVGGWNRREFDMFGIELVDHEARYEYLGEWLGIIRKLWTSAEEFDFESRFFQMKGALSRPQPLQSGGIPIMNAGFSPTGKRFAAMHSDIAFTTLAAGDPEIWARQIADYKQLAREISGREIQVWSNCAMTIRDTREEAEEYLRYYAEEHLDVEAYESFMETLSKENNMPPGSPAYEFLKKSQRYGPGVLVAGTPEDIAEKLKSYSGAGLDGMLMTFVDFHDGLTRFNRDVLPLLEQAGLRKPFTAKAT